MDYDVPSGCLLHKLGPRDTWDDGLAFSKNNAYLIDNDYLQRMYRVGAQFLQTGRGTTRSGHVC